ncbi:MAG TPA: Ig-like domain-containing protein [Solirubrobacteraceae bacterium]|nr:Ig-like domain-containing protein [Solirubrobacteraceae bacterium]
MVAACSLALPAGASAAGVTTHAFMAEAAIPFVSDPGLHNLLSAHRDEILSGAHYPDGGYGSSSFPGGDYGEVSHWERFVNAYVAHIRSRPDCGRLDDPNGACAPMIAHMLGAAAHGMGDEMWDWLFEPRMADYGEAPHSSLTRAGLPGFAELGNLPVLDQANTSEFSMDMIGLVDHLRYGSVPVYPPPVDDLLAVYRSVGRDDITREGILAGHSIITGALTGERAAVATEYKRVKDTMPRSAATYLSDSGGVLDTAEGIAGYYQAAWRKLVDGSHPAPRVVAVHPERNEEGVPFRWLPVRSSPGPGGGGAETRLIAVLSNALHNSPLDPDAFQLLDAHGRRVPVAPGFPRPGPYGNGEGTHSMMLYPGVDLEPCHRYTAVVTERVRDHAGAALREPVTWSFVTRPPDGQAACPPAGGPPPVGPGPQTASTLNVADGHGHVHAVPPGSLVAIRRLRVVRGGWAVITLSCLGPADCRGRLRLSRRAGRRSVQMGSRRYAIPRLRTHSLRLALSAGARRALARHGRLAIEARAMGRSSRGVRPTTRRTFVLRAPRRR